jgi:hypothetical protein
MNGRWEPVDLVGESTTTAVTVFVSPYLYDFCIVRTPSVAKHPTAISMSVINLDSPIRGSKSEPIAISIERTGLNHVPVAMLLHSKAAQPLERVLH